MEKLIIGERFVIIQTVIVIIENKVLFFGFDLFRTNLKQHTLHICSMYEEICHCLYKVRGVQDKGKKKPKLSDLSPLQI